MTKKKYQPTDAELDILNVLWQNGSCTVKQVHEKLIDDPPRGYTTILKLMQIMAEKGLVERDATNRAHVYKAAFSIELTQKSMLSHVMDKAFNGSASQLVMQALSGKTASDEELAEIRCILDKMEQEK